MIYQYGRHLLKLFKQYKKSPLELPAGLYILLISIEIKLLSLRLVQQQVLL
jgi:hypothetical protein